MEFIIENWYVIIAILAIVFIIIEQPSRVRKWLLWAVTNAEKDLGSGTGQLKLRQVYDLFIVRFPWVSKIMPFGLFSYLVDDALVEMRELLSKNNAIAEYVAEK